MRPRPSAAGVREPLTDAVVTPRFCCVRFTPKIGLHLLRAFLPGSAKCRSRALRNACADVILLRVLAIESDDREGKGPCRTRSGRPPPLTEYSATPTDR